MAKHDVDELHETLHPLYDELLVTSGGGVTTEAVDCHPPNGVQVDTQAFVVLLAA